MVTVRVTETYDMKTTVGKLGLIGIHTPTGEQIRRLYPGLVKNYKFIRFKKVDVVGACASVLPADPLSVGVTAGDVAPEDMFNPILYKAVTNSSFDTFVSRIYAQTTDVSTLGSVNEQTTNSWAPADAFTIYYGLLAENGVWRKAMPQAGFAMKNIVPICHTLISTYGNTDALGNKYVLGEDGEASVAVPDIDEVEVADNTFTTSSDASLAITFRGKPVKMPKIPIHNAIEAYDTIPYLNVPKIFTAMLIVPPARLHEFYYRMRVTWTISFEGLISTLTPGTGASMAGVGSYSYGKNFSYSSAKSELENENSSIDANDVSIEKVMES